MEKHEPVEITIGILTVSDRAARGEAKDESGPAARDLLLSKLSGANVVCTSIVPDEVEQIKAVLSAWSDANKLHLIVTTGGTGFSPRDVTPEATKAVLDREAPGLVVAMIQESLKVTPHAMLARPAAGMRKGTLIVNLPGSVKAVKENLTTILPAIPHAVKLLRNDPDASTPQAHQTVAKVSH